MTRSFKSFLMEGRTCSSCKIKTMLADDLAPQGARASAAMVWYWPSFHGIFHFLLKRMHHLVQSFNSKAQKKGYLIRFRLRAQKSKVKVNRCQMEVNRCIPTKVEWWLEKFLHVYTFNLEFYFLTTTPRAQVFGKTSKHIACVTTILIRGEMT